MFEKRKVLYLVIILLFTLVSLTFRPGLWLTHKPANSQNEHYVKGWEDGCISGTNSYSLLYAPLMEKPFIKELEVVAAASATKESASSAKDFYKSGWNEGFTLCRFYQSSVYELMQFGILIVTLLFIGYLLARKKPIN
jgi:hypothetical protein